MHLYKNSVSSSTPYRVFIVNDIAIFHLLLFHYFDGSSNADVAQITRCTRLSMVDKKIMFDYFYWQATIDIFERFTQVFCSSSMTFGVAKINKIRIFLSAQK